MKPLRIGNGCGFWGDNLDAPRELAEKGALDYLTLEYLAELTLSILALQRQRNAEAGYATDFLDVLESLTPFLKDQSHLKIITNAGGMNPAGCGARARAILDQAGLKDRRVAITAGDDLMPRLDAREAYERIRLIRPDVRVLFTTGYAPASTRLAELLQGGTVPVLEKPFTPVALATKVRSAIDG